MLSTFRGSAAWPRGSRELSDNSPWIVFEEKPSDARVLAWLGANLSRVEQFARPAPASWIRAAGADAERYMQAAELLARARIQAAEFESSLRGSGGKPGQLLANSAEFRALGALPEAGQLGRALIDEQRFLAHLREGVALIANDPRTAVDHLLSAAELRPERADAHVYVAAAMLRLGSERAARAALARSLKTCPRILETAAGVRATALGLPQAGKD